MKPKAGEFYYHFKHNPNEGVLHKAYEVIGIGVDSETKQLSVIYKPLSLDSYVFDSGADFCVRSLEMFVEDVSRPDFQGPRFRKMTPQEIEKVKSSM